MNEPQPNQESVAERILEAASQTEEWVCGKRRAITREKVNGKWVTREETGPEFLARRAKEQEPKEPNETEEAA